MQKASNLEPKQGYKLYIQAWSKSKLWSSCILGIGTPDKDKLRLDLIPSLKIFE